MPCLECKARQFILQLECVMHTGRRWLCNGEWARVHGSGKTVRLYGKRSGFRLRDHITLIIVIIQLVLQERGPVTDPTAHALASWCCVLWGWQQGGQGGGGASCLREGCLVVGIFPAPTARLLGVQLGPAALFPSARGVRLWAPVTNPTVHALASCCCVLWGLQEGARGGGTLVVP